MKTLTKLCFLSLVALLAMSASAQTLLTNTTLSAAVPGAKPTAVQLTSTTGVAAGGDLVIDEEILCVNTVPSTGTLIYVTRGCAGSRAKAHASGAYVFVVPAAALANAIVAVDPEGACARGSATITNGVAQTASTLYLPIFSLHSTSWFDCVGGKFVGGALLNLSNNPTVVYNVTAGGTIYTSINTTGTALAATTDLYCSELDLPITRMTTGIQMLNGTSVATDHHIYSLYDASGNLLAASASTTSFGSASEYGGAAFSGGLYLTVGPAKYYTCVQPVTAAGTASIRMAVTQVNDFINAGIVTITAGSAPATITAPTTFTTATGPYSALY